MKRYLYVIGRQYSKRYTIFLPTKNKQSNMYTTPFNPDKIVNRLKRFDYRHELNGQVLKIFLPMFCYLKIDFAAGKVKMTSHLNFGIRSLSLEYNFLLYGLGLYVLAWYFWTRLNKAVFLLFGIFLVHFVICFIKIEALKITIHNWIEIDGENK